MATLKDPVTNVEQRVDTLGAARVSMMPQEVDGEYRLATFTGLLPATLAANSEIFQMRWASTTHLFLLKFLKVRFAVIAGFTAAQELAFDVIASNNWIANGTGGTSIAPGPLNLKKRQSYPDSKVTDMRIAATAALGAGTKSFSSNLLMTSMAKTLAAAATVQDIAFEETYDMTNAYEGPIVFAQNEGFSVRNTLLLGAGGTVRASVQMSWAEVLATDYPTFA